MLTLDWPIPDNVNLAFTDRHGGVSLPPFDSLNLGLHVGDKPQAVKTNRQRLAKQLNLPVTVWLEQVHGTDVVDISDYSASQMQLVPIADASFSNKAGKACCVMTADCLPVLLCDKAGTQVAAVHAGWRGLCHGVIEQAIQYFDVDSPRDLYAFLGPAIGPSQFEVGEEVKAAFIQKHPQAERCFAVTANPNKYLADIVELARMRLNRIGVNRIFSTDICTVSDPNYFSYRRDQQTGRMASLIWLTK